MQINALTTGLVLFGLCFLAGVPVLGVVLFVVSVGLAVVRNGIGRR
jgi:hypothetical protein